MLISPPFLLARAADESDDDWINRCMIGGQPGAGAFPVSFSLGWHGGLHLDAPINGTQSEPVRAIADGEVVFVRQPTPQPAGPLQEGDPLAYGGWTDNGVVVIRHTTEIGEGDGAAVTFYSITMHLSAIRPAVQAGRAVYRKAELGTAGQIYGSLQRQIHLEIVCDDANLERLAGRSTGDLSTHNNGRTNAVYGDLHFHLPAGTEMFGEQPVAHLTRAHVQPQVPRGQRQPPPQALQPVHTTSEELFVGLRYAEGQGAAGDRGNAYIRTCRPDGTQLGDALEEDSAEYNLYTNATAISEAYPAAGRPAVSSVFELLRFGRVIGPDALNPADVPHWRRVRYPGGEAWVNLNANNVHRFSDADLPHWKQWRLIDDSADQDSRCDSAAIRAWLNDNSDGQIAPAEATSRLSRADLAPKLARTICKFPTEWDATTIDARWGWLKNSTAENPVALTEADFELLRAHIAALAFWPGGMTLEVSHWHWQPREFVKQFRRCGWLSAEELEQIYPDSRYPIAALAQLDRTPAGIREAYRIHVNKIKSKYLVSSANRNIHFFAQGAVESLCLALMIEGSAAFTRNPRHASFASEADGYYNPAAGGYLDYLNGRLGNVETGDGPKFRGRGMKQLTGRENYSKYWVYRGWLNRDSFTSPWWSPPRPDRAPAIPDPERLSLEPYSAIDAGGWYWQAGAASNRYRTINRVIDVGDSGNASIIQVTEAINGGRNGLDERIAHTERILPILSDDPV